MAVGTRRVKRPLSEEHRIAVERIEAHLKERAAGPPSEVTASKSTASSSARQAARMAEVASKVSELELEQLQHRLKAEEEQQRLEEEQQKLRDEQQKLHREKQLQEKLDAVKLAKLKAELTKAPRVWPDLGPQGRLHRRGTS